MASHSAPMPAAQARERTRAGENNRALPVQAAIGIFAVLLILFSWLHLVSALQVASTDRQIYERGKELEKLERDNAAILLQSAESWTPKGLEEEAIRQGYKPQIPLYIPLSRNSSKPTDDRGIAGGSSLTAVSDTAALRPAASISEDGSLLGTVVTEARTWFETGTTH